jgi:hypothetical protein
VGDVASARFRAGPRGAVGVGVELAAGRRVPSCAMEGAHDVGGAAGFGSVQREAGEPPFHHEWEARVFALNRALLRAKAYNLDEFRFAVERIPRATYEAASYYERWMLAIERLVADKGLGR